jgi:subtilisin family serine protease
MKLIGFIGLAVVLGSCNLPSTLVGNQPAIRQVRPLYAATDETVTITGVGFDKGLSVKIGGQQATTLDVQTGQIQVKMPKLISGEYDLSVQNPNQKSDTTKGMNALAPKGQYYEGEVVLTIDSNTDLQLLQTQLRNKGLTLDKIVRPNGQGACGKTYAVARGQNKTTSQVTQDLQDSGATVLEADPHGRGLGDAHSYTDTGPNTLEKHQAFFNALQIPRAYDYWLTLNKNLPSPRVAVLDTGVSPHYDFRNLFTFKSSNLLAGQNFTTEQNPDLTGDVGYDVKNDLSDLSLKSGTTDRVGHGTGVAAIIGARDSELNTNFPGVFWQVGVLPKEDTGATGAEILPVKVCDKNNECKGIDVIAGICYAIANKANVINLSLGTQQPMKALRAVLQEASTAGTVIVASAGNAGDDVPHYPAAYSTGVAGLIAVGSAKTSAIASAALWQPSSFSVSGAQGNWLDVLAPGEGVLSASFDGSSGTTFGYKSFEGTSFAAPWVSGIAAMMKAIDPEQTPAAIKDKIRGSASLTLLRSCGTPETALCGKGLVNAAAALGAP